MEPRQTDAKAQLKLRVETRMSALRGSLLAAFFRDGESLFMKQGAVLLKLRRPC